MPKDIVQPSTIKKVLEGNKYRDRMIFDEFGWTGEYRFSEKQILDIIIDLKNNHK